MGDDITKSVIADNGMKTPMTAAASSGGVRACPPPLDLYRESSKNPAGKTRKRSDFKEYDAAEKSKWKTRRRLINARLSAISRSWIEEAGASERYRGLVECGRVPLAGGCGSLVRYENGAVSYNGVARCGSAWACPECAGLKLWKASKKIARLLEWLGRENEKRAGRENENRYSAVLLTLTVPHHVGDSLKNQVAGFSAGFSHLMNSGEVRKAKKSLGYKCSVRAFDFTVREVHEVPDWHCHLHCLLVFDGAEMSGVFEDGRMKGEASPSFVRLLETLWGQWSKKSVKKCFGDGLECSPRAFGLEAVELGGSSGVADYVAKVVSCYISGGSKEKGGEGGKYTPFELLSNRPDGLAFRKRAWLEYVAATKGRRRINFSTGWRERLGGYVDEYDGRDGVDDEAAPSPSWSFNPSADLVALMREKPNMKNTAMTLAELNNPSALISSLCSSVGGGSPSAAGSVLAGSFIADVGGEIRPWLERLAVCDGVELVGNVAKFEAPAADGSKPSIPEVLGDWSPSDFIGVG